MLSAIVFGFILPLATALLLLAGAFMATGAVLRATRTWPGLHDRLTAILSLNSFVSTLVALYVFFLLGIAFWYQFL